MTEIVLLQAVRHLGEVGAVVDVANGYAKNYLIPRRFAAYATPENIAVYEQKRAEYEERNRQMREDAHVIADQTKGVVLLFVRQASERGHLYGSVSARDIAAGLSEKLDGKAIDYHQIVLTAPIKELGVYKVGVALFGDLVADIHLNVVRSPEEAERQWAIYSGLPVVEEKPVDDDNDPQAEEIPEVD